MTLSRTIKNNHMAQLKLHCLVTSINQPNEIFTRYSCIQKLRRIVGYCLRLVPARRNTGPLTIKELQEANIRIIRSVQSVTFTQDIKNLKSGELHPRSKLRPLHPFLDNEGILRVGGRLQNSALTFAQKHPILLPRSHHVTDLIIRDAHTKNHSDITATLHDAVHLEVAGDLTTDAFMAALKRFVARRGACQNTYSDNGTNFVGADNELREICRTLPRDERLQNFLTTKGITWHFTPALSPHFGGLWEAAVKAFKHHIKRVVGEELFTFEQLVSSLAIPNNRLSNWQHIQKVKQHFWTRWQKEYINHSPIQNLHRSVVRFKDTKASQVKSTPDRKG
ncbi:uncharacterized protein LOC143261866 [Megalopta genalis]|uniref:uncharacterized protein LOC143261866 n=1 Tax=Megalopta genalis TaxID=115081 RepID=UPI003FD1343A